METIYVDRAEVAATGEGTYEFVLREGLNHKIVLDGEVFRWEKDPTIDMLYDLGMIDLNKLFSVMGRRGKNDPRVRDLYRRMGYSVYGYWEIFHWEVNNPYADEYEE